VAEGVVVDVADDGQRRGAAVPASEKLKAFDDHQAHLRAVQPR
jgi:hypothetical protein